MKKILLIVLFVMLTVQAEAYILNPSDIYIQEFSTLPYVAYSSASNQGGTSIYMESNLLDMGEVIRLECFENADDITPYFTNNFNTPTDHFGVTVLGAWQDLNGKIKLSMLSGSVNLDVINVQVIKDNDRYYETFSPYVIPEPSSMLLLSFGLLGAGLFRRKKS